LHEELEEMRKQLFLEVNKSLIINDKNLSLAFVKGKPNWDSVDYSMFPAIRWKMLDIRKLKENDSGKFQEQIELLEQAIV
jgi:hypothetical protein